MKKFTALKLLFPLILILTLFLTSCGQATTTSITGDGTNVTPAVSEAWSEDSEEELLSGKHHVNIIIKDKGTISLELDADAAPITVTNFINLAKEGFYDDTVFHRIIAGFMMQGGDPTGTGTGGSEHKIIGEFTDNGIENNLTHTRGAISMARSQAMNSASSQFFIVHQDSLYLDGQYACFGYVTEGMDIVDDICNNTTGGDYNGIIPEENRPVMETIEVID